MSQHRLPSPTFLCLWGLAVIFMGAAIQLPDAAAAPRHDLWYVDATGAANGLFWADAP
jgi:hypothetical protein